MSQSWRTATNANFDDTGAPRLSRAMNVALDQAEVAALCVKRDVTVSAIETLLSGGTRLVLSNADDAAVMRKAFKSKLIEGGVKRSLWVRNS